MIQMLITIGAGFQDRMVKVTLTRHLDLAQIVRITSTGHLALAQMVNKTALTTAQLATIVLAIALLQQLPQNNYYIKRVEIIFKRVEERMMVRMTTMMMAYLKAISISPIHLEAMEKRVAQLQMMKKVLTMRLA